MSPSETTTHSQSAVERKSAEAELKSLIAKYASRHARLIGTVRKSLQKRLPTAHEVVYEYAGFFVISYSPSGHGYEGVLAIRADAEGVRLYFNRGKELADPEKLLKGSGSLVRFIDVVGVSTLARPAIAALMDAAIAGNRVPFSPASAGRGPVVIRSTTARKRQEKPRAGKAPASKKKARSGRSR